MGGSSQTTDTSQSGSSTANQSGTTSATKNPWDVATPYLSTILPQAQTLYSATQNPAATSALTTGQNSAISNATQGNTTGLAQQGMGTVSSLLGTDGLSDSQRSALSGIGSSLGTFNSGLGQTQSYLQSIADGSQVGANNQAFQQQLQSSLNKAQDTISSQFSGSGRYGSAAMGNAEATSLGNIAATATQTQYNQDRANQLAAIGQLGSLQTGQLSGNLTGQQASSNIGQSGIANQLAGIGTISGLGQAQNIDASTLMGVGSSGWDNLDKYASLASTIGGMGSTATGSTTGQSSGTSSSTGKSTTENNPSMLGMLTSGLGLFANLL